MSKRTETTVETPVVTPEVPASETPAQGIALKKLCQELKMDPKKARRLLRKAWRKENGNTELPHNIRERWAGDEAYIAKMRAVLAPTKH